jgi:hypothetical protein
VKRSFVVLTVVALLLSAFVAPQAAEAKKKKKKKNAKVERKVEGGYDAPALIIAGSCAQTGAIGCVSIVTGPKEKFLKAKINDSHGQPAFVSIGADLDGNNQDDTSYGSFCGETTEAIPVDPNVELHLWVGLQIDPAFAGCVPGAATSGTISVTLSNRP